MTNFEILGKVGPTTKNSVQDCGLFGSNCAPGEYYIGKTAPAVTKSTSSTA